LAFWGYGLQGIEFESPISWLPILLLELLGGDVTYCMSKRNKLTTFYQLFSMTILLEFTCVTNYVLSSV
jgi:hypothetical protein